MRSAALPRFSSKIPGFILYVILRRFLGKNIPRHSRVCGNPERLHGYDRLVTMDAHFYGHDGAPLLAG